MPGTMIFLPCFQQKQRNEVVLIRRNAWEKVDTLRQKLQAYFTYLSESCRVALNKPPGATVGASRSSTECQGECEHEENICAV